MLPLNICVLLLFLPRQSHELCTKGTRSQCQEAELAPGTNLIGEGFDITKMNSKGAYVLDVTSWQHSDKTCTLCTNPFQENAKQKLPLVVTDWRAQYSCSGKVSSMLHRSSESLIQESRSSIQNDWSLSLEIDIRNKQSKAILSGGDSKLSEFSMARTKNDRYSFASQSISCQYYSLRASSKLRLSRDFSQAVQKLPETYNSKTKGHFYKLIDTFGTHYMTKVNMGGSIHSVTSIKECKASLQGLSLEELKSCLTAEASITVASASASAMKSHCKELSNKINREGAFSSLFNDRFTELKGGLTTEPDLLFSGKNDPSAYKEWLQTVPLNPGIISYSLESLHELLPANSNTHKDLRLAISHYILERALLRNCSEKCSAGVKSNPREPCVCFCHNDPAVTPSCCPTRKGMARVIVTVQRATGLFGDYFSRTDAYVKVIVNGVQKMRTDMILENNNPKWDRSFDLGSLDLSSGARVQFEVIDEDNKWDDDLLGKCDHNLSMGTKQEVCVLNHGRLFFKSQVTCAPSLSGDLCTEYLPSPMSPSLRDLFVSRHAHPIPKADLMKMGVFVDQADRWGNHSLPTL